MIGPRDPLGSCEGRFAPAPGGNLPDVLTTMPNFPRRVHGTPARSALRRLTQRSRRHPLAERPRVSPAVIEEEAASLLYGARSGMVNASPVGPPLDGSPEERP